MDKIKYSIVIPVYNSEKTLVELFSRITKVFEDISNSYEIIFINDGSIDNSWGKLTELANIDSHVVGVNLMRNFGQHNAIMCGFNKCVGDFIITLDDDLQHPPEEIPKLIAEIDKGTADVVIGSYGKKQHNFIRNMGTSLVKKITKKTLGIPVNLDMTSFRIISRQVIDEVIKFNTVSPRIGLIIFNVTKNIVNVKTEHHPRKEGKSGYPFTKLVGNFLDNIINYSSLPLRMASYAGFILSLSSFLLGIYFAFSLFFNLITVSGFTTIVVLITFFFGTTIMILGLIGEYLIRIIHASEYKPQYIIRKIESICHER